VREVAEVPAGDGLPLWRHPEWLEELPWLIQGTTGRGADGTFDMGLAGSSPVGAALDAWLSLREVLGCRGVVVSRQVHGTVIASHRETPDGVLITRGADGHVTSAPGLAMGVTVADCVPVTLVDTERRRVAVLHAGWRGTAAGIVEKGLRLLSDGGDPGQVRAHLGPAICGSCYEVGPEVHAGVNPHRPVPRSPHPIDLRAAQAERLERVGVPSSAVTVSSWCTRCGERHFHSHRAADEGRQVGFGGVREGG
jgi:polyphenol oxidase